MIKFHAVVTIGEDDQSPVMLDIIDAKQDYIKIICSDRSNIYNQCVGLDNLRSIIHDTCEISRVNMPKTLILVDELGGNCLYILPLFCNGRHYNALGVVSITPRYRLSPVVRTNVDYLFISSNLDDKSRRSIYDQYDLHRTFEDFNTLLNKCSDYMVIEFGYSNKYFYYDTRAYLDKAVRVIQKGCWNWLYQVKCKDGSLGINYRLSVETLVSQGLVDWENYK